MKKSISVLIFSIVLTLSFLSGFISQAAEQPLSVKTISEKWQKFGATNSFNVLAIKEMGAKECTKVLRKSFREGFANPADGKPVAVPQSQLDTCVASIAAGQCDALRTAQNPKWLWFYYSAKSKLGSSFP